MLGKKAFFSAYLESDGGMEVRIDVDQIEGPGFAGIMMADFLRHFANAFHQSGKAASPEQAAAEIIELFMAEIQNPTDEPTGEIQN